ncbi:hypothetical protein [Winogradskyella sp.]
MKLTIVPLGYGPAVTIPVELILVMSDVPEKSSDKVKDVALPK